MNEPPNGVLKRELRVDDEHTPLGLPSEHLPAAGGTFRVREECVEL
jgi:hypothetical protein